MSPEPCACAKGWIGFDRRVPICEQGYYEREQPMFAMGTNDDTMELEIFEKFMEQKPDLSAQPKFSLHHGIDICIDAFFPIFNGNISHRL